MSATIHSSMSARGAGFEFIARDDIAVLSIEKRRAAEERSLRAALAECVVSLLSMQWGGREPKEVPVWSFFAATRWWEPLRAVQVRQGVWGALDLRALQSIARRSLSVVLAEASGSRLAGVLELPEESLLEAADQARSREAAFLLLSQASILDEGSVRCWFASAFPAGGDAVEWGELASAAIDAGAVVVRVGGRFDDRDASLDCFMSRERLESLKVRDPGSTDSESGPPT